MRLKVPILLYHDFESFEVPNEKTALATKFTVVQRFQFEAQLKYLVENGYQPISLNEFFQKKDTLNSSSKNVIITFDDGHYSHYHIAFELLQRYNYVGTFFIITNKIDQFHYLTKDQIREMADSGMEIGSHGVSHHYLPLLSLSKINVELKHSKSILEDITGYPVNFFAYPGGHFNKYVLNQVGSSGYTGACSCLQGINCGNIEPFLLRRLEVRSNISINDFQKYFNPINILYYQLVDNAKQVLRTTIGLNQYSKLRQKLYKFYPFKR